MPNASRHWGLVQAVAATLQGMATGVSPRLPGFASTDQIRARAVPAMLDFTSQVLPVSGKAYNFPAIVCCYWDKEVIDPYSNAADEYGYPVLLAFGVSDSTDPEFGHDQYIGWRQEILSKFIHQDYSIADPATIFYGTEAQPGPVIDWTRFLEDGLVVGTIGLRFFTNALRG